jgi:hypothetical protein
MDMRTGKTLLTFAAVALALVLPSAAFALPPTPSATTQAATSITATSATLNGTVNSGGLPATWHYEYATDADFNATGGYTDATPDQFAGVFFHVGVSHPLDTAVSAFPTGLASGTTYHFRVVLEQNACLGTPLENSCPVAPATANGGDLTFTTL